jgi:hypothetical protein
MRQEQDQKLEMCQEQTQRLKMCQEQEQRLDLGVWSKLWWLQLWWLFWLELIALMGSW